MAVVCGPLAARKQFWGLSKSAGDLLSREQPDPGCRELYGQRYAFQSGAYLGHRPSVLGRKFEVRVPHRDTIGE